MKRADVWEDVSRSEIQLGQQYKIKDTLEIIPQKRRSSEKKRNTQQTHISTISEGQTMNKPQQIGGFGAFTDSDSSDEDLEFVKQLQNIKKQVDKDSNENNSPFGLVLPPKSESQLNLEKSLTQPNGSDDKVGMGLKKLNMFLGARTEGTKQKNLAENLDTKRILQYENKAESQGFHEKRNFSMNYSKSPGSKSVLNEPQKERFPFGKDNQQGRSRNNNNNNNNNNQNNNGDCQQNIDDDREDEMKQIPYWAQKNKSRDAQRRQPSDPEFDPTTLFIPPEEFRKLSNIQKQYWSIKSLHFDKVIFFKFGKFYVLWYEDALVGQKVLDLQLINGKLSCGFPEKSIDKYARILVKFGYKIVVVEQVSKEKNKSSVVDREIVKIITRGTIDFTFEEQNQNSQNLVVLRQRTNHEFGIVVYDSFTGKIQVGEMQDDNTQTHLKTFLCICKPSEIVYDPGNITFEIMKILKSSFFKAQLSPLKNLDNQWGPNLAAHYINEQYGNDSSQYPIELQDMWNTQESTGQRIDLKYSALAGLFSYMKYMLRLESVLQSGEYIPCDFDQKTFSQHLIIDSQALQHLQILQNSNATSVSDEDNRIGTVINYLDHTRSHCGKRLLKKWICSPLTDIAAIEDRLDALEDINNNIGMKERFTNGICKFPDIERLCSSIYRYSVRQKQSSKALMYEDISGQRLNEFKTVLDTLEAMEKLLEQTFIPNISSFQSNRLKRLCSYKTLNGSKQTGDLPKVTDFIHALGEYIEFSSSGISGRLTSFQHPLPKPGVNSQYDQLRKEFKEVEQNLQQYLAQLQSQYNSREIIFVFSSNRQYDIEIPKKVLERIKQVGHLREFTLQSATNNAQRFTTPYVCQQVAKIEGLQEALKQIIADFSLAVFAEFYKQKDVWDKFVSIVAELDCLVSLSHASFTVADGVMCRPVIKFAKNQSETFFNLKQGRNPNLSQLGGNQIPNDIQMGNIRGEQSKPTIMILTGPNMGGKSTTLRLFCTMAIIAQIGCYVPAQVCEFSLVDRIFTRIGAGDKLIEGKSTFYIEMEEVKNSLMYGTYNSLAIFDELGRGTSTFDGVAIAYGILKYFIEKVQSRCIFATHFFLLINELRFYKEISFFHMEYFYDKRTHKLIFKYKLKSGNADSSFGIQLAKIVGIEDSVLRRSEEKKTEFENSMQYGEVYKQQKLTQYNSLISKLFTYENKNK